MKSIRISVAGLFIATMLTVSIPTGTVQAAVITNAEINEQKRVVMLELVDTLQEQLKLYQMLYIVRLEAQVASLQARIDSSS